MPQPSKSKYRQMNSPLISNRTLPCFGGNVKGFIPRENIEMTTAKLRLVSGKDANIEKMVGEGGVQVKQWDREVRSDFAIYTQVNLENS